MTRVKFLLSCIAIIGAFGSSLFGVIAGSHSSASVVQDQTSLAISTELVQVFSGLNSPVYITNAHDGTNRLFVIEKPGRIRVAQPGATATSVFLDISAKVLSSGSEQGLLGLAFHPQFATNRRFFVNYTRRPDGATVVAEYQASQSNGNVTDANETVLLVIAQPFANHNGGMIEFGRDGFLYIGLGDGGSANDPGNRAQNINELLGKMLRIDVDRREGSQPYSTPSDNPFAGSTAGRDEIYAYGLRNPWRFSFDRVTGELYAADVGQGAREEINIITRGGNYGWRVMEGNSCSNNDPALCNPSRFVAPITEYNHSNQRCSITGGYVYRGAQASLPLGSYVYGDFCTGEIFLLSNGASSVFMNTNLSISSFGEDEAGEIYVVSLAGTIHRFANTDPPPPPGSFKIVSALVRRRSSGEIFQPVITKSNGKKYEIVVFEEGAAPAPESVDAKIFINGRDMKTDYTTNEAGAPIFVARLRRETIRRPGLLTIEVVRADGSRSNQLTIPVTD
jgi:glucose/arabinose dehydrogenase